MGLWAPLTARTAFVAALVSGALAALTFVPFAQLSRRAAHGWHENRGNVAVYLVTLGAAIVVGFLVARP